MGKCYRPTNGRRAVKGRLMQFRLGTLLILLAVVPPVFLLLGQERGDPVAALYGEWKIIEMIHLATVQDLGDQAGSFVFVRGGVIYNINREQRDRNMRN